MNSCENEITETNAKSFYFADRIDLEYKIQDNNLNNTFEDVLLNQNIIDNEQQYSDQQDITFIMDQTLASDNSEFIELVDDNIFEINGYNCPNMAQKLVENNNYLQKNINYASIIPQDSNNNANFD